MSIDTNFLSDIPLRPIQGDMNGPFQPVGLALGNGGTLLGIEPTRMWENYGGRLTTQVLLTQRYNENL